MKITAEAKVGFIADAPLQLRQQSQEIFAIVKITVVRVRRCHHVLNAVIDRDAAHRLGNIPGLGTIVHFRQDVAVNIDHEGRLEQIQGQRPSLESRTSGGNGQKHGKRSVMLCLASTRPHTLGFRDAHGVCRETQKCHDLSTDPS